MKRNTKELILSTALAVIARDGNASVNAIIQEAGLSKGVFFHHFRSKQELLLELLDIDFNNRLKRVKTFAKTLPDRPGRMLKAYILAWEEDVAWLGRERLNVVNVLNEPLLRERLAEQERHAFDMLWDPGLNEATVRLILNACIGGWAHNLLTDDSQEAIVRQRKTLAAEMFRIIDQAADQTEERERLDGTVKPTNAI